MDDVAVIVYGLKTDGVRCCEEIVGPFESCHDQYRRKNLAKEADGDRRRTHLRPYAVKFTLVLHNQC